jgi:tRNA-dihydrouridine synthase B
MVSCAGIDHGNERTLGYLRVAADEHPLAIQLFGSNPGAMAEAARMVAAAGADIVDINFGCPVRQVTEKAHSGSYLLRFPDRMGAIIERVVAACRPTPVTAKIRLGCTRDRINAIDVAQVVEGAGASALAVHGRTAQDFFKGTADWEQISAIKPHLKRIPLIGNGDLDSPAAVVEAFRRYQVDGVMIARAALGRPWLFAQAQAALSGAPIPPDPTPVEERDLLLHHYELVCRRFGVAKGTILMRKYACCYAQGRRGARNFRARIAQVNSPEEFALAVAEYFPMEARAAPGTAVPGLGKVQCRDNDATVCDG